MSARGWRPGDLVWRNSHVKVLHFVPRISLAIGGAQTACGISVPAPITETRRFNEYPQDYAPCTTCYPLGRVL